MSEEPSSEGPEFGINVLTGLALFLYVIALFVVVSFDGWFFYWTSP